ncbi:hypothetical protein ACO0QE_003024 [Hanseniaspora vineae]
MSGLSMDTIAAYLILDNKGERIYTNYYSNPFAKTSYYEALSESKKNGTYTEDTKDENGDLRFSVTTQRAFEQKLFKKTHKQNSDILIFDNHTVLYKEFSDVCLYLVSKSQEENELLLQMSFDGIKDALELVLENGGIDKSNIKDNYDVVSLIIDEAIDDGVPLEFEGATIASRITTPPNVEAPITINNIKEKGLLGAWGFAKNKLAETLQQNL